MLSWLANHLTAVIAATGVWGVYFTMLLESAWVPLPSEIILPFAGVLVMRQDLSFAGAVGWALAGQITGMLLVYWLGASGGRHVVERYGHYLAVRPQELLLVEGWFRRFGDAAVFGTRLLPVVRGFVSFPAGLAHMPLWRFSLFSLLGSLPWTAFLVWLGMKVGRVWQDPRWQSAFHSVEYGVTLLLIAAAVVFLEKRWNRAG